MLILKAKMGWRVKMEALPPQKETHIRNVTTRINVINMHQLRSH